MGELETAQRDLRRPRRHRQQPRARVRVVDQRLEVVSHGAELAGADVQRLPGHRRLELPHDCVDEILDGEQLVAVLA